MTDYHSRACGIALHAHGSACHPNCPTCGGQETWNRRPNLSAPQLGQREIARRALTGVLRNASNYPEAAQAHLLGRDMGSLIDKAVDAVLAALVDWEYGVETNGSISFWKLTLEEALEKKREWDQRAAQWRRDAAGQASYPNAYLVRRTPAVAAGNWTAVPREILDSLLKEKQREPSLDD